MNEALQRWREGFDSEPDTAFDRLVRGVAPLGGINQLSFGEILDALFEPGDAALDAAAASWLEKRILGPLPENTSHGRWISVLEEYFRGIAAMELPQTGEILRRQHKRLRLWLHGFYEGPDRDPEGAYLIALARAQDDQRFSPLWRRLILGEELAERPYLGIGILGFRKKPEQDSRESSGVPEGLLQALVELAEKPGTGQAKWKQTMRSLFATYRRNENYWVEHLAPLLPYYQQQSKARDWLTALLPRIREWRPQMAENYQFPVRRAPMVPIHISIDWAQRVRQQPDLCDTPEFSAFLDQHRKYAETTGDPGYINKTFNNLSMSIIRADSGRAAFAVSLMEEALEFAPWNPHNWTSYAIVLSAANREDDAVNVLWKARYRFAWNQVIRNELGRVLREAGDYETSADVLREAASLFPGNPVILSNLLSTLNACGKLDEALAEGSKAIRDFPVRPSFRNLQAELLRQLERSEEAREVYEQTRATHPDDVFCRTGLADLLIDLDQADKAEIIYREALEIDAKNAFSRGGLARALAIRSARNRDFGLRDEAKRILQELAYEGNNDAKFRLLDFDSHWERAITDRTITFRRDTDDRQPQVSQTQHSRARAEMSTAERLGRAILALWHAERAEDPTLRSSLCADATALLEVPDNHIEDDLLAAFVETRGLVLLASGEAQTALSYFEEQIQHYGRGGWIGIRLGEQRARIILGVPNNADETVEISNSQSARFALYVARVIQSLSTSTQEYEARDLLKTLYPRAAEFAARAQPASEGESSMESGAEMLGAFLQTRWFRPAGIQSAEDFDRPDALHAVVERINNTRTDTFDVISNSTLAVAA